MNAPKASTLARQLARENERHGFEARVLNDHRLLVREVLVYADPGDVHPVWSEIPATARAVSDWLGY